MSTIGRFASIAIPTNLSGVDWKLYISCKQLALYFFCPSFDAAKHPGLHVVYQFKKKLNLLMKIFAPHTEYVCVYRIIQAKQDAGVKEVF